MQTGGLMASWDPDHLLALRRRGDREADEYIQLQLDGLRVDEQRKWLTSAVHVLRAVNPCAETWVIEWQNQEVPPAPWMDQSLVTRGQSVFDDWLLEIVTSLFFASLPDSYASGRGAVVL